MSICLKNYQDEISILANIATIMIPIVLAFLGCLERRRKDKESKRESEKFFLINFIKEEIYPLEIDKYDFKCEKKDTDALYSLQKKWIGTYSLKFAELGSLITTTSYTYTLEYFITLSQLISYFVDNKNTTTNDYSYVIPIFNTYIKKSVLFLTVDKKKYNKIPINDFNNFLKEFNNISAIVMEILKNYPAYYEKAQKFIQEQENKLKLADEK